MIPEFAPHDPQSQMQRTPHGCPGTYRVTFILSLPGREMYRSDLSFDEIMQSGDSLLIVHAEAQYYTITVVGEGEPVTIIGIPNARHAMAKVQMRVTAQSFGDAARYTHNLIMPLLSRWSYDSDVAIDVAAYEVYEEATGSAQWTLGLLGRDKGLTVSPDVPSTEVTRRLLSSYREGLSGTNVFYRVLCFYRVVEGVRKQRDSRREKARAAGMTYCGPLERIPDDDEDFPVADPVERKLFQSYHGKRFNRVLDDMRTMLRNAVAHLDPDGDSLVADSYDDTRQCEEALPVLKYIARQMLQHEIEMQSQEAVVKLPEVIEGPVLAENVADRAARERE